MSNNQAKIVSVGEIDVSKLKFGQPKSYNMGKTIYFNHGDSALYFQTPISRTPFGITYWDKSNKYNININLTDALLKKIQEIESRVVDEALKECQSWFNRKYNNRAVVNELFTSSISWSKNKETGEINNTYPPTLKLNLQSKDDRIACEGYRKIISTNEVIPMEITKDSIGRGANVAIIVHCNSIWVAGSKFGCTFKVAQMMRVDETPEDNGSLKKITGFAFIEDSDQD
jgi:hypothetical protein